MRRLTALASACLALGLGLALASCAKPGAGSHKPAYTAVNEAYALLDKGETAQAIELLENLLRDQPGNDEARLLLASAYMGRAGVDVLSLHDAFHDVLFSRSLSDVFFATKPAGDPILGNSVPSASHAPDDTPVEKLFEDIDEFLNNLRRVLVILNRFPHIPEHNWPLLEQALANLDQLPPVNEVRIYRMFIRLVYVKEVLVTQVVRDPTFATRVWACQLDVPTTRERLQWVTEQVSRLSDDFNWLYPREASPFTRLEAMFKLFDGELRSLEDGTPSGGETGAMLAQRKIKEALRCGDSVH